MSDFLDRLVGGGLTTDTMLQPSIPSRFEPVRSLSIGSTSWAEGIDLSDEESAVQQTSDLQRPPADRVSPILNTQHSHGFDSSLKAVQTHFSKIAPPPVAENSRGSRPAIGSANQSSGEILERVSRTADVPRQTQFDNSLQRSIEDPLTFSSMPASVDPNASRPAFQPALNSSAEKFRSPSKDGFEDRQEYFRRLDALAVQLQQMQGHLPTPVPERFPEIVQSEPPRGSANTQRPEVLSMIRSEREARPSRPPQIIPEDLPSMGGRGARTEPTINVTIGRVEVKASREQTQPTKPRPVATRPTVMTLDDYLQRRAAGGPG